MPCFIRGSIATIVTPRSTALYRLMSRIHDAIVVGKDPEGLVCASYLARAGLDVVLFECGDSPSAGQTDAPERVQLGASPTTFLTSIADELQLENFDFQVRGPNTSLFVGLPDSATCIAARNQTQLAKQLATFAPGEVRAFESLMTMLRDLGRSLSLSWLTPFPSYKEALGKLETAADEAAFADIFLGSLGDLLDRYFVSAEVKAFVAALPIAPGRLSPSTPGSALSLLLHVMSESGDGCGRALPLHALRAVTCAARRAFAAEGGVIRSDDTSISITTREGGIQTVELQGGEQIVSKAVVSSLPAAESLKSLMVRRDFDPQFANHFKPRQSAGGTFLVELVLKNPPRFAGVPVLSADTDARQQIRFAPALDDLERNADQLNDGRIPSAPSTSTVNLESLTGKLSLQMQVYPVAVDLTGASWIAERDRFGQLCIEFLNRCAPNLASDIVEQRFSSPADLREVTNDRAGEGFELTPASLFRGLPLGVSGAHRTPVAGLYLCGADTVLAGAPVGVAGHNASREILSDLQISV